jgi:hypothetical protein
VRVVVMKKAKRFDVCVSSTGKFKATEDNFI